jgi:hypothetical protein
MFLSKSKQKALEYYNYFLNLIGLRKNAFVWCLFDKTIVFKSVFFKKLFHTQIIVYRDDVELAEDKGEVDEVMYRLLLII